MHAALALLVLLGGPPTPRAPACPYQAESISVRGSLAASFGPERAALAAHFARIYMWDLDLRRDVVAGDEIHLLWRTDESGELEIAAASYRSQRLNQTLLSYRHRSAADPQPSYWDETGQERPRRLQSSPLSHYDEITALLKDRPTHQGMDFKTPIGTEVRAPRAGVVTRIDWKPPANGRCLEIQYRDGTLAKFLHLSAIKVPRGAPVHPGQLLALTGNTGHSTAPHLHYQLSRARTIIDPVDYHGVTRRRLTSRDLAALRAVVAELRASCGWAGE
jgi:murein DD-endopeptidase